MPPKRLRGKQTTAKPPARRVPAEDSQVNESFSAVSL